MRLHEHQMALITSDCVPFSARLSTRMTQPKVRGHITAFP